MKIQLYSAVAKEAGKEPRELQARREVREIHTLLSTARYLVRKETKEIRETPETITTSETWDLAAMKDQKECLESKETLE